MSTISTTPKTTGKPVNKNYNNINTNSSAANNSKNVHSKNRRIVNMNNIRIAKINVRTLQDDLKLALIVKAARDLNIDILVL